MGFLQRFLMKEAGNLADKVLEKANQKNSSASSYNSGNNRNSSGSSNNSYRSSSSYRGRRNTYGEYDESSNSLDDASFDRKIEEAVSQMPSCSLKEKMSIDDFEKALGCQIYTRGRSQNTPADIDYVVSKNGTDILYIRLWSTYNEYCRVSNREITDYCKNNGIKMVDFFEYLPNRYNYIKSRIEKTINR